MSATSSSTKSTSSASKGTSKDASEGNSRSKIGSRESKKLKTKIFKVGAIPLDRIRIFSVTPGGSGKCRVVFTILDKNGEHQMFGMQMSGRLHFGIMDNDYDNKSAKILSGSEPDIIALQNRCTQLLFEHQTEVWPDEDEAMSMSKVEDRVNKFWKKGGKKKKSPEYPDNKPGDRFRSSFACRVPLKNTNKSRKTAFSKIVAGGPKNGVPVRDAWSFTKGSEITAIFQFTDMYITDKGPQISPTFVALRLLLRDLVIEPETCDFVEETAEDKEKNEAYYSASREAAKAASKPNDDDEDVSGMGMGGKRARNYDDDDYQ